MPPCAPVDTTISQSKTWSIEKSISGFIPAFLSDLSVINSSSISQPVTSQPASFAIIANGVMPTPLIPTKWILFFFILFF